jgi:plastocyanin
MPVSRTTAFLVVATLLTGACASSSTGGNTDPLTINIQDNQYVPATKAIVTGQTLTWSWQGNNNHSVTFSDGPTSPIQTKGATYTRTFATAGSYTYHCMVHGTAMTGTITVTTAVNGITY